MNQKSNTNITLLIYGIAFTLIVLVALQPFTPASVLTGDPLIVAKGKFYYGAISSLGSIGWTATSTICLVTYFMLSDSRDKKTRSFFLFSGLFSVFLLVDDLFMLHDDFFPNYLGVSQSFILALYPILSAFLLINYRGRIAGSSYTRLFIALGFLALSVIIDDFFPIVNRLDLAIEDGFKFLGIVGWAIYFFDTAFTVLNYEVKRPKNRIMPKVLKLDKLEPEFSNN
ncbi:MAG: hypothetical protein JWQ28_1691 [Pedobacter sp.]|jgi:hypothetical protein|nr:hypothetical protein [Pedobacter sp.]